MTLPLGVVASSGGISSVTIFDATTGPNSTATGGWYYWHYDGSYASIGTTSTYVYIYSPWWTNGAAATNNNIDLTGATSITIDFAGSSDNPYGYASVSWYLSNGTRSGYNIINPSNQNVSRQLITIPITNGGNGKFTLDAANCRQNVYLYGLKVNYA